MKRGKILWVSQHPPLPAQVRELRDIFGVETLIFQYRSQFADADEIIQSFTEGGYDEMVVVAPLTVIAKLTQRGIKPLLAEMKEVSGEPFNEDSDVMLGDIPRRHMRFLRFRRIRRVTLEFEEQI